MSRSKVIVTTTTLYPDFTGNDKVRFDLICQLCEEAKKRDYAIVIADGSCDEVKDAFVNRGAHVIAQEKGMGPGRRQVWKEAAKLVDNNNAGILWTEEKPGLIASIESMVEAMRDRGALVVIPARKQESWKTYPEFQRSTEEVCLMVYNEFFRCGYEVFDPMFGPVFFHSSVLPCFIDFSPGYWGLSDTYIQHYVPIYIRKLGMKVTSHDVEWSYPVAQRLQEEGPRLKDMLEHRLRQQRIFVSSYLTLHRHFSPLP